MTTEEISHVKKQLLQFIENRHYVGWDPYDTLNTKWGWLRKGKWPPVLAIQLQKRSPLDLRKILGVQPGLNPKTLALMLQAHALEAQNGDPTAPEKCQNLVATLKDCATSGYSGYCWGYHFDWASPVKYLKAYSPTVVVTGFVSKGLREWYRFSKDEKVLDILNGITKFIRKDLAWTTRDEGVCVSYSTEMTDLCYNASLLAGEHLAAMYNISGNEQDKEDAVKIMQYVVNTQQSNGAWFYSADPKTGKERKQIDFHQGYVIDSIAYIAETLGVRDARVLMSIEKGMEFYRKMQFTNVGRSLYRWPKMNPLDIHNQSQGIITFSRQKKWNKDYLAFARTIVDYTIKNMWDRSGHYFYYRKFAFFTMKTPMMRWAQAWMYLAITQLEIAENEG